MEAAPAGLKAGRTLHKPAPMSPSRFAEGMIVRQAALADVPGMARVHVDGWKTAYRGIVPDRILDPLTVELDISTGFGAGLRERRAGADQFVALTPDQEIVGYAVAGPNRDPDPDFAGELEAIYVLTSYRGEGIGTTLVRESARHLLSHGMRSMIVWVLAQNPYRRFYHRLGAIPAGSRMGRPHRLGGGPLAEVSFGWRDLRSLADF
jgi:ribosomal protein S18 acetylase RimI-like enzyme